MGILFYLTTVSSHYPPAHLAYNNFKCNPDEFVRCGACVRAAGEVFQELLLSTVKENSVLTAMY